MNIGPIMLLIKKDMKQALRDPMLGFYLLGPLALILALRFGVPAVTMLLQNKLQFDLSVYYELIMCFALLLLPLILGCLAGFMMLDERDENIIQYFAVTPLTKKGYLCYRLGLAVVLTLVYSILMLSFAGLTPFLLLNTILLLPMMALEAPIFALFMVAFASNKVEGLALSKGASLFVLTPLLAYFIHSPWQYLGGIVPSFWLARTFLFGSSLSLMSCILLVSAGYIIHLLIFYYLLTRFLQKAD